MFRMHVAIIAKKEGGALEVFPGVPSLSLNGFHAEGADQRELASWKKAVLHYAAMERWKSVYFLEATEHCILRENSFPAAQFPGDSNFAIFPVKRGNEDEMPSL